MTHAGGESRHGGILLRLIVRLALCAVAVAIAIACFANWKKDGSLSLRVFDPEWWMVGKNEAQPVMTTARQAADDFYDKLWGEGGWAELAERWLGEQRARHASQPDTAEGPQTPDKSAETRKLEADLGQAREAFEQGMIAYNKGNPANGGWNSEKKGHIQAARESFARTRERLDAALPAYQSRPDCDRSIAADAKKLEDMNLQLLRNCNKMLSSNQPLRG